ncbi:hypothetical protein DFJ77DRAFT_171267 [Powellomyces hirtus]|nr:hypothetical protein DFJ77DRAFT_171267 [Powellomyces hirtus]
MSSTRHHLKNRDINHTNVAFPSYGDSYHDGRYYDRHEMNHYYQRRYQSSTGRYVAPAAKQHHQQADRDRSQKTRSKPYERPRPEDEVQLWDRPHNASAPGRVYINPKFASAVKINVKADKMRIDQEIPSTTRSTTISSHVVHCEALKHGQTLRSISTLPQTSFWPTSHQTWPSGHSSETVPVLRTALALFDQFLNNDAILTAFQLQCIAVPDPATTIPVTYTAAMHRDHIQPATIRAHIREHWPHLRVGKSSMNSHVRTKLCTKGNCVIDIAEPFFMACVNPRNETEALSLAVILAIKLMNQIGHVLMFKVGYENQLDAQTGCAFPTPSGMLGREAGNAWEIEIFSGTLDVVQDADSTKAARRADVYGLHMHEPYTDLTYLLPLSFLKQLVSVEFWNTNPKLFIPPLGARVPSVGPFMIPGTPEQHSFRCFRSVAPEPGSETWTTGQNTQERYQHRYLHSNDSDDGPEPGMYNTTAKVTISRLGVSSRY